MNNILHVYRIFMLIARLKRRERRRLSIYGYLLAVFTPTLTPAQREAWCPLWSFVHLHTFGIHSYGHTLRHIELKIFLKIRRFSYIYFTDKTFKLKPDNYAERVKQPRNDCEVNTRIINTYVFKTGHIYLNWNFEGKEEKTD